MGLCSSKRIFMVDETVLGQNSAAVRAFRMLELSDDDIEQFYLAFKKFDVVNNETVEINEFLPRLGLGMSYPLLRAVYYYHLSMTFHLCHSEKNRITKEVFADIDRNDDGRITFREFVLSVWKYVVLGRHDLAGFAFDMYDTDNSGFLSEEEVINMVAELYGTKNLEDSVNKMIRKMDKDKNHRISKKEFAAGVRNFPQILHPAFDIQTKMRKKIIGDSFWAMKEKTAPRILQNPDVRELLKNTKKRQDAEIAAMHLPDHAGEHSSEQRRSSRKSNHNNKN